MAETRLLADRSSTSERRHGSQYKSMATSIAGTEPSSWRSGMIWLRSGSREMGSRGDGMAQARTAMLSWMTTLTTYTGLESARRKLDIRAEVDSTTHVRGRCHRAGCRHVRSVQPHLLADPAGAPRPAKIFADRDCSECRPTQVARQWSLGRVRDQPASRMKKASEASDSVQTHWKPDRERPRRHRGGQERRRVVHRSVPCVGWAHRWGRCVRGVP